MIYTKEDEVSKHNPVVAHIGATIRRTWKPKIKNDVWKNLKQRKIIFKLQKCWMKNSKEYNYNDMGLVKSGQTSTGMK